MNAQTLAAAASDVIANRIATRAWEDMGYPTAARYGATVRSASAWVRDANTVVVDVIGETFRYVAAEILDTACGVAGVAETAHIFDTRNGALVYLKCKCDMH